MGRFPHEESDGFQGGGDDIKKAESSGGRAAIRTESPSHQVTKSRSHQVTKNLVLKVKYPG